MGKTSEPPRHPRTSAGRKVLFSRECLGERLPQPTTDPAPIGMVGQIVSGEELVKDTDYRDKLRKDYSDARAIENEGYGLVRAGNAGLKVLVIRGASDHADEGKTDSDQPFAAQCAAAFAAQVICDYLTLTSGSEPIVEKSSDSPVLTSDEPTPETGVSTAYDRAATTLDVIRDDIDLLEDDEEAVIEFAKREFAAADSSVNAALVELLAAEVDDRSETLVGRRMGACMGEPSRPRSPLRLTP